MNLISYLFIIDSSKGTYWSVKILLHQLFSVQSVTLLLRSDRNTKSVSCALEQIKNWLMSTKHHHLSSDSKSMTPSQKTLASQVCWNNYRNGNTAKAGKWGEWRGSGSPEQKLLTCVLFVSTVSKAIQYASNYIHVFKVMNLII